MGNSFQAVLFTPKLNKNMDLKQIQELIRLVTKSGIAELKVKEGDFAVSIKNVGSDVQLVHAAPVVQQVAQAAPPVAPAKVDTTASTATKSEAPAEEVNAANTYVFRSPMIGTFYRKPGADKEPFVKVGDTVKNGDVLCIVEAMKLFNEIEFDGGSGKIVKILTDDTAPVEYDQPLFLIEKLG